MYRRIGNILPSEFYPIIGTILISDLEADKYCCTSTMIEKFADDNNDQILINDPAKEWLKTGHVYKYTIDVINGRIKEYFKCSRFTIGGLMLFDKKQTDEKILYCKPIVDYAGILNKNSKDSPIICLLTEYL